MPWNSLISLSLNGGLLDKNKNQTTKFVKLWEPAVKDMPTKQTETVSDYFKMS